MNNSRFLRINFFPLRNSTFVAKCWTRECSVSDEPRPDVDHYLFPGDCNQDGKPSWLTATQKEDWQQMEIVSTDQPFAVRWLCARMLLDRMADDINSTERYKAKVVEKFRPQLEVKVKYHDGLGWQGFIAEFDWNSQVRRHGLYVNFHFFRDEGCTDTISVQKLSHSLDKSGCPNKDIYKNNYEWICAFSQRFLVAKKWTLPIVTDELEFETLVELPCLVLHGKSFEFGNSIVNRSVYWGLRSSGPYQVCPKEPTFYFIFREVDRPSARFLYECLSGKAFPARFSGMTNFFHVHWGGSNVRYIAISSYSESEYERTAVQIVADNCVNPVAIVLVPGDEETYLQQKSVYLNHGIPSQDVTIPKLLNSKSFQWSVAGLALQLFCKAGGIPWCVQTPHKHDIIIGISQLWMPKDQETTRFVAYSVTTDANGLFKDIRTLSDKNNESDYVKELAQCVRTQLVERIEKEKPERIVLHCSFRLLKSAMTAIRDVVAEIVGRQSDSTQIVIMRINTEHHFHAFDINRATMVPDENTILKFQSRTYLVWPDGTPANGAISTRPSMPMMASFDRAEPPLTETEQRDLLQDLCNLAGANWRGFNAKARPVSVFYCHLVGKMMADMAERGIKLPRIEKFVPWFL